MKTTAETLSALDIIYSRRSVRAYTAERVPESTVRALLDAAVQAPSTLGGQSLSFVVVQHQRRLEHLSELTKTWWLEHAQTDPNLHLASALIPATDLARCTDPGFDVFYGAGTLIVICARRPDIRSLPLHPGNLRPLELVHEQRQRLVNNDGRIASRYRVPHQILRSTQLGVGLGAECHA